MVPVTADEPPRWLVAVLVRAITFGRHFRASYGAARCQRKGHTEAAARFAWPPEPGRYAASALCRRCGETYEIDVPVTTLRGAG